MGSETTSTTISTKVTDQPTPVEGKQSVTRMVMADLADREKLGIERYGRSLQTFNGRMCLVDLYQELIDATQYCRQEIEERTHLRERIANANAFIESGDYEEAQEILSNLYDLLAPAVERPTT
jgi:hypothetical protein